MGVALDLPDLPFRLLAGLGLRQTPLQILGLLPLALQLGGVLSLEAKLPVGRRAPERL